VPIVDQARDKPILGPEVPLKAAAVEPVPQGRLSLPADEPWISGIPEFSAPLAPPEAFPAQAAGEVTTGAQVFLDGLWAGFTKPSNSGKTRLR
jgi:hypothetical protein